MKSEILMEALPLISIIMAAFNAEKTIGYAIESVLAQTYTNWELLIVDDCSTDNTLNIAKAYSDPRIHVINNEINMGVSKTRANGLKNARGDWIAILDSDDVWKPEKLQKQMDLVREADAKLVFTGSGFMKEDGTPIAWVLHVPQILKYRQLLKQNLISNSSAITTKELYQKYYAYGDNMHEDFAIWLGITKSGVNAYGIDEPLLIYRLSRGSKSSNKIKAARMNWNTYRSIGLSILASAYYEIIYIVNGIKKYMNY